MLQWLKTKTLESLLSVYVKFDRTRYGDNDPRVRFLEDTSQYLTEEVSPSIFESNEHHHFQFQMPLFYRQIFKSLAQEIVIATGDLAQQISKINPEAGNTIDPQSRAIVKGTALLLNTDNNGCIMTTREETAINLRKKLKQTLKSKTVPVMQNTFDNQMMNPHLEVVDFYAWLNKKVVVEIATNLMGLENLPVDDTFSEDGLTLDHLLEVVSKLDKAVMSMKPSIWIEQKPILDKYSAWLWDNNDPERLKSDAFINSSIAPAMLTLDNPKTVKIAGILLVTANMSRLICFSTIKIAGDQTLQLKLRQAFNNNDTYTIQNFYKEASRMYAGLALVGRFFSSETAFEVKSKSSPNQKQVLKFPANTLFDIPRRHECFREENFGPDTTVFNPDRFNDENTCDPLQGRFSPFGFVPRMCPAAVGGFNAFVYNYWLSNMAALFSNNTIQCKQMEDLPVESNYIELKQSYNAKITRLPEQQHTEFLHQYMQQLSNKLKAHAKVDELDNQPDKTIQMRNIG